MSATEIAIVAVLASLFAICLIYLFLAAPKLTRKKETREFMKARFAHRGLHNGTRAENSLSAFAAAVEAGYGIELDVRLSADGVLVVFHDDTLDRMTEATGRVDSKTLAELGKLHLGGTGEGIPTFEEVLRLVDGRVPLVVEIKEDPFKYAVTEKAAEVLSQYRGSYVIESFNPFAVWRFKKLMPGVIRGQLADNYLRNKKHRNLMYFGLQIFLANFLAAPDFIAYNHKEANTLSLGIQKHIFHPVLVAWTVKSEDEETRARKYGFEGIIFENYEP